MSTHVVVLPGLAGEPVGEAGPAEAEQPGVGCTGPTLSREQPPDTAQPVHVRHAHDLVPLGLPDGNDRFGPPT